MNGYDAQDMATQGADGFRNGYQAGYADARTAAAPGIDLVSDILTDLSCVGNSWVVEATGAAADAQNQCAMQIMEAIEQWSNRLNLGDASPKGGSDALASAASRIVNGARKKAGGGWWMVSPSEMDELRDALAHVGYRTDGTTQELAERCHRRIIEQQVSIKAKRRQVRELAAKVGIPLPPDSPKGGSTDAEPMFYIQDTRSFVGNCPVWWGQNGNGYVTRLDEAGRFTEQEAIRQNRTRGTDLPWPCDEIDKLGRITVDVQHMRPRSERLAELQATSAEVGS